MTQISDRSAESWRGDREGEHLFNSGMNSPRLKFNEKDSSLGEEDKDSDKVYVLL